MREKWAANKISVAVGAFFGLLLAWTRKFPRFALLTGSEKLRLIDLERCDLQLRFVRYFLLVRAR